MVKGGKMRPVTGREGGEVPAGKGEGRINAVPESRGPRVAQSHPRPLRALGPPALGRDPRTAALIPCSFPVPCPRRPQGTADAAPLEELEELSQELLRELSSGCTEELLRRGLERRQRLETRLLDTQGKARGIARGG